MCWGTYLRHRYHVPDPASIRLDCTLHQVHTCFDIDVTCISLLWDNIEALDINDQQFQVQWTEYQVKFGDCVACMTVMVIRMCWYNS